MKINPKIIVISTFLLLITLGFFYNKYHIFEKDRINNTDKYINSLSHKFEKKGIDISNLQLKSYLSFIDDLYSDGQIQIDQKYYYIPEDGQTFSYREQYLFYFLNY